MCRVSKHDALIATLAYGDVFDYPLTRQELILWFLYYPVRDGDIPKGIGSCAKHKKASWQSGKWMIAQRASRWLSLVPAIQLVGVTGGLAVNNAGRDDDIDLFFIVADGTLWVSRMLATILMDIIGLRRHPRNKHIANKVCLNMFMTEGAVKLAKPDRDFFTAHEVLQMQPLFVREDTYKRFLRANQWVSQYLPNAWRYKNKMCNNAQCTMKNNIFTHISHCELRLFESPARAIQLWYMQKHRTHEVITDTTLRFHPKDARVWIRRKLRARLAKFNIPLDKVFYAS
jgi:hypothetical protein